ncbi:MAG: TerB family tellurite resistance protein [Candidatus Hydrogenedentales bacterium]
MLNRIKELFISEPTQVASRPQPETISKERMQLATCVLLLEVARADEEFTSAERDHVIETLKQRFQLSYSDANELVETATASRDQSNDLWSFTSDISRHCDTPERIRIMEEIWRVVYADGQLEAHEDFLVHRLAKLLNITHKELIETKMRVLNEIRGDA